MYVIVISTGKILAGGENKLIIKKTKEVKIIISEDLYTELQDQAGKYDVRVEDYIVALLEQRESLVNETQIGEENNIKIDPAYYTGNIAEQFITNLKSIEKYEVKKGIDQLLKMISEIGGSISAISNASLYNDNKEFLFYLAFKEYRSSKTRNILVRKTKKKELNTRLLDPSEQTDVFISKYGNFAHKGNLKSKKFEAIVKHLNLDLDLDTIELTLKEINDLSKYLIRLNR